MKDIIITLHELKGKYEKAIKAEDDPIIAGYYHAQCQMLEQVIKDIIRKRLKG